MSTKNNRESDADLVSLCVSGSVSASDEIADRVTKNATAICLKYWPGLVDSSPGHATAATEISSAVWVRLARNDYALLRKYDPMRGALSTFLGRVIVSEIGRRFKREGRAPLSSPTIERATDDRTVLANVGQRELLTTLHKAAQRLPQQQRQVFMMREQEFSFAEIGELLGLSEAAAKQTWHRARKALANDRELADLYANRFTKAERMLYLGCGGSCPNRKDGYEDATNQLMGANGFSFFQK